MGKKILNIDDDRTLRAILEKALIMRGFWVYSAKDGAEGNGWRMKNVRTSSSVIS